LGKDFDRTAQRAVFKLLGEDGRQSGLKLRHRVWAFFACEGRGRFGLARLYTSSLEYLCTMLQGAWRSGWMPLQDAQLFIGFGIRYRHALGHVCRGLVQQDDVETLRIGLANLGQKEAEAIGVQVR
jgi:hypothetical protein